MYMYFFILVNCENSEVPEEIVKLLKTYLFSSSEFA